MAREQIEQHLEVDVGAPQCVTVRDGLTIIVSALGDHGLHVTEHHSYIDETGPKVDVRKHSILPPEPSEEFPFDPSDAGLYFSINGETPDRSTVIYSFQRKPPRATIQR